MGSDVWMNYWLNILISIVDSAVNIRLGVARPALREKLEWCADVSAPFLNYKVSNMLMGTLLYAFVPLHGNTMLMVGVDGSDAHIPMFWPSELPCVFVVALASIALLGFTESSLVLRTRQKYPDSVVDGVAVAHCSVESLLRQMYISSSERSG
ncbi:hypothetical protein PybrP1_003924 [[Pythium] brassicae (nom. inval.)]|nr:hypothetical protein PybrP1_003924 [[Pythium] brassicae (nom. inval.)]